MVVNTKNKEGHKLSKRFLINTNDPLNPQVELEVAGTVKGYITVSPPYVLLMGQQRERLSAKVDIRPAGDKTFTIKRAEADIVRNIQLEVKALGDPPGHQGYRLTVTNTKTEPGSYNGFIEVETDLKEKPLLRIPVRGRIFSDASAGE